MGESLLDKEVEIEVKTDREYGFTRARMVTTASVLTPARARFLLDAGLDLQVRVSIVIIHSHMNRSESI